MSQHCIIKGRLDALIGFDTRCNWFYLVVSKGDEILYSNLNEPDPCSLTLEYFISKAKEYGIEIPGSVIDVVLEDKALKRMNHKKVVFL